MGYFIITILIILSIVGTGWSSSRLDLTKSSNDDELNVISYGAVGDGETDDTQAFLRAWEDLCGTTSSNPTLVIPSWKIFLLQSVAFHGPCKSPTVHILLSGTLVAPSQISTWSGSRVRWIEFRNVDGLILDGSGQIDGKGYAWWSACGSFATGQELNNACTRPTALSFQSCNELQLSGLQHINSARNHISISGCNGVTVSGVHVVAPEDSPNTDGFDISHSTQVVIKDSFIGTGDDCVAINSGCSFINITNVACGPGHGISVGSLGKNGANNETVEEVHVQDCTFTRTMNGVRIKTWQGGSGYAKRISFDQIRFVDVRNPIIIDQYYCPAHNCKNHTLAVQISDVSYTQIQGTSSTQKVIDLCCSQTTPCKNIKVDHVKIQKSTKGSFKQSTKGVHDEPFAYCYNVQGESTDTSPPVRCLS